MREHLIQLLCLAGTMTALAACAQKPQPLSTSLDCTAIQFPTDTSLPGAVDELAGEYWDDSLSLSVKRDDYRLLINAPQSGNRELRRVEDWRFEDGCGVIYQFSLPLDHLGRSLEIRTPDGSLRRYRQRRS